jgi:hypothetical protein
VRVGGWRQYLWATLDADKNYFDGAKPYKVTLPKGISADKFWSLMLYDNMSRSMLDTPQRYRARAELSVTRRRTERRPPGKGFFPILRLYSSLESFFTKEVRPSEVELVQ